MPPANGNVLKLQLHPSGGRLVVVVLVLPTPKEHKWKILPAQTLVGIVIVSCVKGTLLFTVTIAFPDSG